MEPATGTSGHRLRRGSVLAVVAAIASMFVTSTAKAQGLPPELVARLRDFIGSRIEGAVILAGDQGFSGGTFSQATAGSQAHGVDLKITKFGAAGPSTS
jgi:hypothetical protein